MSTALDTTTSINLAVPVAGKLVVDCVYEIWAEAVADGDPACGVNAENALVYRSIEGFDFSITDGQFRPLLHGAHYEHLIISYPFATNWCAASAWKFTENLRRMIVTK